MTPRQGSVLILGARSDIGRAIAAAFAREGRPILLAARNAAALEADATDLGLRYGVSASTVECDVLSADPAAFFEALPELPAVVVSVVGYMGDQTVSERDPKAAEVVIASNFTGPALLLGEAAERMAGAGGGAIIGVSSVAGDRGRRSNYVYGSAKAGLTAFLSGLRHRFAGTNVFVMTVKPGFVNTRMTEGMKLPGPLTAQPAEVAEAIVRGLRKGREVIYVRPVWRVIMTIIRCLPEPVFKKMKV